MYLLRAIEIIQCLQLVFDIAKFASFLIFFSFQLQARNKCLKTLMMTF